MRKLISRQGFYLFINTVVLFTALLRIPDLFNRPDAPFTVELYGENLRIKNIDAPDACPTLNSEDLLLKWDSLAVSHPLEIEFLAEMGSIDQVITVTVVQQNAESRQPIRLIPYYPSPRNIMVILFVGLITWIFGVIILIYGPDTTAKTVLHWTITGLGLSVMLTTGSLDQYYPLTYITEFFFHIFYTVTIGGFLYFSILFPKPKVKNTALSGMLIFAPLTVLTAALIWQRFKAISFISLEYLQTFIWLFDIFHLLIFICIGGGIIFFIIAYRTATQSGERLQNRWILWGVIIGSTPFLLLSILPQFFGITEFVAEEYTVIFFLVIPFAFTMAIVRYRLLDIDILISRTLVYAILTFFIGSAYFMVLFLIISAIGNEPIFEKYFSVLLLTLLVTVFFNPLRVRVQLLVDNYLFTARGQYRDAMLKINREMGSVYNTTDLYQGLVNCLASYIPAENFAFYIFVGGTLELATAKNVPQRERIKISSEDFKILIGGSKIIARPGLIPDSNRAEDALPDKLMNIMNFNILIPVMSDPEKLYGILACNPHHQKDHLIEEEVDLLLTATSQMSQNLKRILLQERVLLEREEKKRLKAINDLMSFYVSSVSHELKSPLSAIQLHTEILRSSESIQRAQQNEHLDIIKGEGERLQRLIENVLDISKIERGVRSYHFKTHNPNDIVLQVLRIMQYQLNLYNVTLVKKLDGHLPEINADNEALQQALINLIDNAIKYSSEDNRLIEISSELRHGSIILSIRDNGIGIERKEEKKIFSRFFRGSDSKVHSIGGAGIGLTIVEHVAKAHRGRVQVESKPGEGSKFSLIIPAGS